MTQSSKEQDLPEPKWPAFLTECKKALLAYPSTALALIFRPSKFFKSPLFEEPPQLRLAQATTFLVVTALIATISEYFAYYSCPIYECLMQLIQRLFSLVGLNYAFAVVMHLLLKLFRSKGAFIDTFVSANYCSAQLLVVGVGNLTRASISAIMPYDNPSDSIAQWFAYCCVVPGISYLSLLVPLYGCFIFVRGIQNLHKMSRAAISIAVYLPVILFFLPAIIGAVIVALVLGMISRH